jgi:hypothetical protein
LKCGSVIVLRGNWTSLADEVKRAARLPPWLRFWI